MAPGFPNISEETRLGWQGFTKEGGVPHFFNLLSRRQKSLYRKWFTHSWDSRHVGETSLSAISVLLGLILGNGITRIVQCGHYAGYSLMTLGMLFRNLDLNFRIVSFDIDQGMTNYTDSWLKKARISDAVSTFVLDSADPYAATIATECLGGAPELVFIDSSHQYRHTLAELDLWASSVVPGGILCAHDAAKYAESQDYHGLGGVSRALGEWTSNNPNVAAIVLQSSTDKTSVYKDPCGLAILQIMEPSEIPRPAARTNKRLVADPGFEYVDQWIAGDEWEHKRGAFLKSPGASSTLSCYAPVVAGEVYQVQVQLLDVKSGCLQPGAGGGQSGARFDCDGLHTDTIVAGPDNSLLGLLASKDFYGRVTRFEAKLIE